MWSSSSEEHHHNHQNLATNSSKSSSSSSSYSYNHPINPILSINSKTMEEVWKDINLSCSRDAQNTSGMVLQDLLARPFANDPSTAAVTTAYGSPVPPPPVTMLTLNSVPEFHFFSNLNPIRQTQQKHISNGALASPDPGRKRHSESDSNNSRDLKNKRMIKNRESAARSRARKQAYTNELEMEIANLMEENARLKRQQQQLCLASSAGAQLPKKKSLNRTSTAPF
ncbi:protein FD-like [Solanum pennellii]|uniref:Protein FD-like n=1 Tax=Solanum pennellii TaxID=28526 RepID=A0ABM1G338_SOLPN|nr:protein FD-like [Solanum pennellii]